MSEYKVSGKIIDMVDTIEPIIEKKISEGQKCNYVIALGNEVSFISLENFKNPYSVKGFLIDYKNDPDMLHLEKFYYSEECLADSYNSLDSHEDANPSCLGSASSCNQDYENMI